MKTRYTIVGAGLAGAATARWLARAGAGSITLLEREPRPGQHASVQNARMIRQLTHDPQLSALLIEGTRWFAEHAAAIDFRQTGSLLAADADDWPRLRAWTEAVPASALEVHALSADELASRAPLAAGGPHAGALFTPSDGTLDVAKLLALYLEEATAAGASLQLHRGVIGLFREGGAWRVELQGAPALESDVVVIAGGAWSGELAALAGATPIPFEPRRRHVFASGPRPDVDPATPWVWDMHGVYFRPTGAGGLLLSPCDTTVVDPGNPALDLTEHARLQQLLADRFPRLTDVLVSRAWAGLRTFPPDDRFVVGWDTTVDNLFWVAGLGGHGLTTSPAIGALAARLLTAAPGTTEPATADLSPARFS